MASFKRPSSKIVAAALYFLITTAAVGGPAQNSASRPAKAASAPGTGLAYDDPGDPGSPGGAPSEPKYFDQGLLVRSGETVQPLGPNLMGDLINEYTGGLSFSHTDVSIPGNNALQVAVGRRLVTGTRQATLKVGLFGDWDLELPHLRSVALQSKPDWYGGNGYDAPYSGQTRCSQLDLPPSSPYYTSTRIISLYHDSWWDGHQLVLPGGGSQTLLRRVNNPPDPVQR